MDGYTSIDMSKNKNDEKILSDLNYFIYRKVKNVFQNRKQILEFEENKAVKKTKMAYINSIIEPKKKNPYRVVTNLLKKIISNKMIELEKGNNDGANTKRNALKLEEGSINIENINQDMNIKNDIEIDKSIFDLKKKSKFNKIENRHNLKLVLNKFGKNLKQHHNTDDEPSSVRKNKPLIYPNNHIGFIEKDYSDINSIKLSEHSMFTGINKGSSFLKEKLIEKEDHIRVRF